MLSQGSNYHLFFTSASCSQLPSPKARQLQDVAGRRDIDEICPSSAGTVGKLGFYGPPPRSCGVVPSKDQPWLPLVTLADKSDDLENRRYWRVTASLHSELEGRFLFLSSFWSSTCRISCRISPFRSISQTSGFGHLLSKLLPPKIWKVRGVHGRCARNSVSRELLSGWEEYPAVPKIETDKPLHALPCSARWRRPVIVPCFLNCLIEIKS
jgi:hypothetical protein